ncbi:unnamed protein product [Nesidiocoris tenuis]|uniref:Uncharacterized protein n=1 Tax=Nesidiocoris tenuis TaxID=355587 RepID=A0A6H5HM34_9HEMI|nr:unnamed protein product [Nesidiocoris tenuis]
MTLSLPDEKREKISKLLDLFSNSSSSPIRRVAQLLGTLSSACPAIKYGRLYTKLLERAKDAALKENEGNYNRKMTIPDSCQVDLKWWQEQIKTAVNELKNDSFDLCMSSDASRTGWGCICRNERAFGWWSEDDLLNHINFLELKAIFLGLQSFASNLENIKILIRTDNTTALASVNKMGSIQHKKLNTLARKIWQWCEARNIWIFASYITSKDNHEADAASRILPPETEWMLDENVFQSIISYLGQPKIDLFASYHNTKCPTFISWYQEPQSWKIDNTRSSERHYPGSREAIREAYLTNGNVPSGAVDTMISSLSPSTLKQYANETPTPTRFIRNCEAIGLFQDLNPFEETFKKAVENVKRGCSKSQNTAMAFRTAAPVVQAKSPLGLQLGQYRKEGLKLDIAKASGNSLMDLDSPSIVRCDEVLSSVGPPTTPDEVSRSSSVLNSFDKMPLVDVNDSVPDFNFSQHKIIRDFASTRGEDPTKKCLGLIAYGQEIFYIWESCKNELHTANVKQSLRDDVWDEETVLRLRMPPLFTVERLLLNSSCSLMALTGPEGVAVLHLPESWEKNKIIHVPCVSLGERIFQGERHLLRCAKWNPGSPSDSHLVTLTSDECLRCYNVLDKSVLWSCHLSKHSVISHLNIPSRIMLGDTPVNFDFVSPTLQPDEPLETAEWPILVLWGNGNIFYVVSTMTSKKPTITGPLLMSPASDDNYGSDASSLIVIRSSPPLVILSTCSGT